MLDVRASRERNDFVGRDFSASLPQTLNTLCPLLLAFSLTHHHLPLCQGMCSCFSHSGIFNMSGCPVLSCSNTCPHNSKNSWWLSEKSSLIISSLSPLWQTVKEESLTLPAVNPLVTPQKSGNTLDHNLHKDLFGAISGIGNAPALLCPMLVSFWKCL